MIEFSEAFRKRKDGEDTSHKPGQKKDSIKFSTLPFEKDKSAQEHEPRLAVSLGSSDELVQRAKSLYEEALAVASSIVDSAAIGDEERIRSTVKNIIDFTATSNQELIESSFSKNSSNASYQALNLLNVCILSVQLGLIMQLDNSDVFALAVSAFLHDAGILRYRDIIYQSRKLTNEEYEEIKKHPSQGRDIISQSAFGDIAQIVKAIEQEHERIDGSGYPQGCTSETMGEFAKIIGFVDVYEALTHKRPWREAYDFLEAIKIILNNKGIFDSRVIKHFLEHIGLYPKGTLVELNTKEVAQVLFHNPHYPMAPSIRILYDSQSKKVSQPRDIDLSKKATIYIVKCLKN